MGESDEAHKTTTGHNCKTLYASRKRIRQKIFLNYFIKSTEKMNYYFKTSLINITFDEAIEKTIKELQKEGFGVLTEIDIKTTLKKKLDVDFYNYKILGACNAPFAYKALQAEDKIGTMLPCNVIIQEKEPGKIEVSAVDPLSSMVSVENKSLGDIAAEVRDKLKRVIENL